MFRMPRFYIRLPWWAWLIVGVYVLAAYAVAAIIMLIWLLLKGLWFVLAVLPYRAIVALRQRRLDSSIHGAERRMQDYMDR
jgi:hypothetical protein